MSSKPQLVLAGAPSVTLALPDYGTITLFRGEALPEQLAGGLTEAERKLFADPDADRDQPSEPEKKTSKPKKT